jgi:glycerol-3-phosphate acyltransferase PlsY
MAGFVLFNHRTNIKRLNEGTENRISFSKKKA